MEALIAGEAGLNASRCPVCRTTIYREKAGKKSGGKGVHWQTLELKFTKRSVALPDDGSEASVTKVPDKVTEKNCAGRKDTEKKASASSAKKR
jgi:hypothetical protein